MRIALVTEVFLPAVDGVVTRLTQTLEHQRRRGDEVLVLAPAGCPPSYAGASVLGMKALRLPLYPDGDGYPEKRVSFPQPALGRALNAFRPDVIHTVNPVLLGLGAVFHARRSGVPLVASYHAHLPTYTHVYGLGALESTGWRYVRSLHNHADVNLCTSRATMQTLRARGFHRLELWPHGIATPQRPSVHELARAREELSGGDPHSVLLLYVGRLAKEKQVQRLRPLIESIDGARLAVVGDGPLRAELEREFAGTRTIFAGLRSGAELAAAYAAADVFVFPSESETLGLVLLEAHAAGLPVVTAATPVGRELVTDGVDGLIYEPGSVTSMIEQTRLLVEDEQLRAKLAGKARDAVSGASWEHATDVLREHYKAAIETHRVRIRRPRRGLRLSCSLRARGRGAR
ncbi:MAG: glycosyltransferase family 4 protein [Solirubrobacteraceae bacterium]